MADSLDDFFAKKDKKRKNKSQTAAFSAEALVRELEEGAKQSDFNTRREGKPSTALELLGLGTDDNEWKDFEEVEKRDYTGLKVKEMSIQDQDDEQRRLTEQTEQVPETIPWKSKHDTVAAIISARNELNQLPSELIDQQQQQQAKLAASDATTTPATTTTTTSTPNPDATSTTNTASKTDNTDSDVAKAVPSSTQSDGKPTAASVAAAAATATASAPSSSEPSKEGAKSVSSATDESKKDGDTKPAAVVKKAYVPPHERMEREVKILEPTRLSKLKSSSSRPGARINIEDENMFPSLG